MSNVPIYGVYIDRVNNANHIIPANRPRFGDTRISYDPMDLDEDGDDMLQIWIDNNINGFENLDLNMDMELDKDMELDNC